MVNLFCVFTLNVSQEETKYVPVWKKPEKKVAECFPTSFSNTL